MPSRLGILQTFGGGEVVFLYESEEAREETWTSLTPVGREKMDWSKVIVDIRGQVLEGITPTQARALSFTDSMHGLTMRLAKAIIQGDWKEAHRIAPLVIMDSQVLQNEVMPQVFEEKDPEGA